MGLSEKARQSYIKATEEIVLIRFSYLSVQLTYLDKSNNAEAVKQFEKVIALDKTFVASYNQLALIYFNTIKRLSTNREKYLKRHWEIDPQ